jgi:hypothetical protein
MDYWVGNFDLVKLFVLDALGGFILVVVILVNSVPLQFGTKASIIYLEHVVFAVFQSDLKGNQND